MYLKSLTVKGFKSFASPTTLEFEPGVTCVVGPNGSGKSNVVDALSWVMGEQGAKSLRGGKMEDVIFAGTSGKSALGRAEVSLTIDNTDQALPIDFTEVTISRIMFRSGGSEYAINGTSCRLLDVQELLSDSGIGREMHVIVGQGQLDSILHATAEDRRGFIEEAAGVLKHRKRKEKALRKLSALTEKLSRLTDLKGELRRQLKPLGRQAEVAKRAVVIQSDVRDARLRLLAEDLQVHRAELAKEQADEAELRERRTEVEAQLLADQATEAALVAESEEAAPQLQRSHDLWFGLSELTQRFRSIRSVAAERAKNLAEGQESQRRAGGDPAEMDQEAGDAEGAAEELAGRTRTLAQSLSEHRAELAAAETALIAEERRVEEQAAAASNRREMIARLTGNLAASRSRLDARKTEVDRIGQELAGADERAAQAASQFGELESQVAELSTGEVDLDQNYEDALALHKECAAALKTLQETQQEKTNTRAAVTARLEALTAGLATRSETPEFVREMPGVGASVAELVHVAAGHELALTALLGEVAAALVADAPSVIADILNRLVGDGGSADLVLAVRPDANAGSTSAPPQWSGTVGQAFWPLVTMPAELEQALAPLFAEAVLVDDVPAAYAALAQGAQQVVTLAGTVVTPTRASAGTNDGASVIELAAQLDAARANQRALDVDLDQLRFKLSQAQEAADTAESAMSQALSALHASDAQMSGVADRLGSLGSQLKAAKAEKARLQKSLDSTQAAITVDEQAVTSAAERLAAAESESLSSSPDVPDNREALAARVEDLRKQEMDTRLELRTDEERLSVVRNRITNLRAAAAQERAAAAAWEQEQQERVERAKLAAAVQRVADVGLSHAQARTALADTERQAAESRRAERDKQLNELRIRVREVSKELDQLTDSVHKDEMVRTEQRLRIQQIETKAMEELGIEPEVLLEEYGPHLLVPPSLTAPGDEEDGRPDAEPYPYVRAEQERRLRSAERAMKLLGKVNPLALEEFAAMEERHQFLSEQIDDLKHSQSDLMSIIAGVDERVEQVFAEAFADTAREFERVFARLFPGGDGRLVLTDPKDMLTTGIEVEARPPGKKIKRLSLLSGGERSLTAVAFLVALFKARPSPFYVLDEVEAALDDVNLGRLIEVIEELRAESQLIVITHQKRTMEAADALYGVTMRGDGVSRVISQRIEKAEPVVDLTDEPLPV
ncbi:MAG: chromosome segregation protein SMC [Actinomycetia bacterium]|nr:chromosome segregation protein SMC [Actinomycetes bacterium]